MQGADVGFSYVNDQGFITTISLDGHADFGLGLQAPFQNYWHYWFMDEGEEWIFSGLGAESRRVEHGDIEAWVFGSKSLPVVRQEGDATDDNIVDAKDLNIMANNWQDPVSGGVFDGDFNVDGVVNAADLNLLGNHWQCNVIE